MAVRRVAKGTVVTATDTQITVSSTGPVTLLDANGSRRLWTLQNLSTAAVYFRRGTACSTSQFSFILSASTAPSDGRGGSYSEEIYVGIVTAYTTSTGAGLTVAAGWE